MDALSLKIEALTAASTMSYDSIETLIVNAEKIFNFLSSPRQEAPERPDEKETEYSPSSAPSPLLVRPPPSSTKYRPHYLKELTPIQRAVLNKAIDLYHEQGRVTGADIGRALGWPNPVQANPFLKRLQAFGYVRREGWKITPLFKPDTTPVGVVIQKLPDGVAIGYKPMTAKLGEIGRVS